MRKLCLVIMLALFLPAVAQAGALDVSWDANTEADLAGYKLYYGTVPGSYGAPLTLGKVTAHQLTGLKDNTVYYIALTAYDTSGNESAYSVEISADTGDQLAPGPPQGIKARRPIPAVHVSSPGL
jgi:hypothetical protein